MGSDSVRYREKPSGTLERTQTSPLFFLRMRLRRMVLIMCLGRITRGTRVLLSMRLVLRMRLPRITRGTRAGRVTCASGAWFSLCAWEESRAGRVTCASGAWFSLCAWEESRAGRACYLACAWFFVCGCQESRAGRVTCASGAWFSLCAWEESRAGRACYNRENPMDFFSHKYLNPPLQML